MKQLIFLKNYNNYFNRTIFSNKKIYPEQIVYKLNNPSFNVNDGIRASQIVNADVSKCDYAIFCEDTNLIEGTDYYEVKNPDSRWFILEAVKQRTGQYLLTLKRDVLADNLTSILESPMFVEKGTLPDDDAMIYNDEGMVLNKIKTEESLLKGVKYGRLQEGGHDSYNNSAWIVGYVTKQELRKLENEEPGADILNSIVVAPYESATQFPSVAEVSSQTGISESTLISILTSEQFEIVTKNINVNFGSPSINPFYANNKGQITYSDVDGSIYNVFVDDFSPWGTRLFDIPRLGPNTNQKTYLADCITSIFETANSYGYKEDIRKIFENNEGKVVLSREEYQKLKSLQGIYYNGANYDLSFNQVTDSSSKEIKTLLSDTNNEKLKQALEYAKGQGVLTDYFEEGEVFFYVEYFSNITVTKTVSTTGAYTIPFLTTDARPSCTNSPCDIFVIPLNNVTFKTGSTGVIKDVTKISNLTTNNVLKIASEIAKQLGSQLYDIQLLPYIELPLITAYPLKIKNVVDTYSNIDKKCSYITKNGEACSFIYWLSSPSFTINNSDYIPKSVSNITNPKIQSQTQMCRIVSPTGQGMFDFNPAKNGGFKSYRINCTLKPYSPYIQILPIFNKMYGDDFNDYRGLICSGDFSLSRVQSAWIEYQLQNKNYQNIFNREMENLDFNQRQEAKLQPLSVATGAIGAGISGAVAGGVTAGPWGAVAGAVVGAGTSAAAGLIDLQMAEQKRFETKDYAKDRYSYQLGNVKAIPNSITKVGTFVINSKIFPFIEVYDCTLKEKEALENKIKYDGMTVNRIGYLSEFIGGDDNQQFVKGQMIRLNDLSEDSQTANEIYDELLKGVYI